MLWMNAYKTHNPPDLNAVVSSLFARCPPFGVPYFITVRMGFGLFGHEHECVTTRVVWKDAERPWGAWRDEIEQVVSTASGSFVCSGSAPLAMWMLLGRRLWDKDKAQEHVVVNFRTRVGQVFHVVPLMAPFQGDAVMELVRPEVTGGQEDVAAVLYVATKRNLTFSPTDEKRVEALLPGKAVQAWRLQPTADELTVDSGNFQRCRAHIMVALDEIHGKCTTLVLATSSVDAVAFAMGASANVHKFSHIICLEYVRGRYDVAFDLM
jgi:hypothetical protein